MKQLGYFLFLFLFPLVVSGQVYISEIMYDVEGADSGREWIEVFNSGSVSVDLGGWKIFENDTNHKINLFDEEGSFVISSGGYAVVADNPTKFLEDWPGFSGLIFDSAFSLKNSGEEIILRDDELNDVDSIFYDVELGAEDGKSLQKINNLWEVGSPTPGEENKKEYESIEEGGGNESAGDEISIDSKYIQPEDLPQIKAYAGKDKTAIAGAMTGFEGEAYGLKDELLDNARYLWNLGNGALKDGKNVVHFYKYPGEYRVVLDVSSGGYSVSDILILKVVPNEIFISEIKTGVDSFLELRNPSSQEIDISGWRFVSGNQKFTFSKNSFIRPYSYLVIPSYSSGIIFDSGKGKVDFLYSSGLLADSFVYGGNLLKDQSFSRNGDNIGITKETPGSKNEKLIQKQTNVRNLSAGRQGSTLNISREVETSEVSSNYRGPTSIVGEGEDKEEKVLKEDAGLNQNQQANIVTVGGGDGINKKYYYLGVLVLIVFAGVGIYVIRRKSRVW